MTPSYTSFDCGQPCNSTSDGLLGLPAESTPRRKPSVSTVSVRMLVAKQPACRSHHSRHGTEPASPLDVCGQRISELHLAWSLTAGRDQRGTGDEHDQSLRARGGHVEAIQAVQKFHTS